VGVAQRARRQDGSASSSKGAARAAVYHRVSTIDQDPAAARTELRAYVERIGARLELEVEEVGSGARNDRPGWRRVMAAATRGRVDVVIVWALDRCGRSALDVLASIEQLTSAGVRFVATSQSLDVRPGGDAMSSLVLGVLAAVAQFERQMIRERTRVGIARARERGSVLGRPRADRPSAALVVRMRAAGHSWAKIAAKLRTTTWIVRSIAREAAVSS
jgi:DNA invertase Pin-like site-specific DNA recombinase